MPYPDLMFTDVIPSAVIEPSVYEDMKLTSMLSEATISTMLTPCSADDILARQELFAQLKDVKKLAHIKELSEKINIVAETASRYADSRCDNEKYLLYLKLTGAVVDFFHAAEIDCCDSRLYNRFTDYFKKRVEHPNFIKLVSDRSAVAPKTVAFSRCQFKVIADELRISSETPGAYMTRLIQCASQLGLEGITPARMAARTLDPSIYDATARLFPEEFAAFKGFYERNKNFYEDDILRYKKELDFYLDITALTAMYTAAGIPATFPKITAEKKIDISNCYDITLLTKGEEHIIPNDVYFDKDEPFFYLTGANGGGKTTYLRTAGVSTLLFLNGCPVPCDRAEIYPLHNVFTHFPRDERFDNAGRNAEEQQRVERMLSQTDGCALVLLNETYSTTSEEKALTQTTTLADRLYKGGEFGVYVTHHHGLGESEIPYLNVLIDRGDSNRRTYKVARQKSVYSSYAYDILKKYSLTKEQLDKRFQA